MNRVGAGFNPQFLERNLTWPSFANYLEAGTALFRRHDMFVEFPWPQETDLSLHLSRSPFCGSKSEQVHFVKALKRMIPKAVSSIGLHLCGPLNGPLGKFGFGDSFLISNENCVAAIRFLRMLQDELHLDLFIENANFYDSEINSLLAVIEFANELASEQKVGLILDLAHLLMSANNLGTDPGLLLGRVLLAEVKIVHVSGVVRSPNGLMHDGHQLPVDLDVWRLLQLLLPLLKTNPIVVVEHTDPAWTDANPAFATDFYKARSLPPAQQQITCTDDVRRNAALGYLSNVILPRAFPKVFNLMDRSKIRLLVAEWAKIYESDLKQTSCLPASVADFDLFEGASIDPIKHLEMYLNRTLS